MPEVLCNCGSKTPVRLSAAGTIFQCDGCGQKLIAPSLRVLKQFDQRGEAAPAAGQASEKLAANQGDEVPESFAVHYCGEVGTNGYVSALAMQNYISCVSEAISNQLHSVPPTSPLEVIVSCALLPTHEPLIVIETQPTDATTALVAQLQETVRKIPRPRVERGPVAFWLYRRVNLDRASEVKMQPFSCYAKSIQKHGRETALAKAAGAKPPLQIKTSYMKRFWNWARKVIPLQNQLGQTDSSPVDRQAQMKTWLSQIENQTTNMPIEQVQSLASQSNQDTTGRIALAAQYVQRGEAEAALQEYNTLVSMLPEYAALLERRARVHMALNNGQAALQDWNAAIELAPDEPEFRFYRACIYAELEAWPTAEDELNRACSRAPSEPGFALLRADVLMKMERFTEALSDLEHVVELDPNCRVAHMQLSQILQHLDHQDLDRPIHHLTRAIELLPEEIGARVYRSLLYAAQNKHEHALADCDHLIQMHPDDGIGHGVKGRVLQLHGEFEEAISACCKAIDLGLQSPLVLTARAISYAATEEPKLALSDCNECLVLEPENAVALQLQGMLQMQLGELDSAMNALQKAIEIAPDWAEPREHLALLHRINEDAEAAIKEQSILVSQEPDNPAHYVNRAFAYAQFGDFHRALQDFDRASELDPENEHIVFLRACFFMDRQDSQRALDDFDRVLQVAEDHDEARLRRASLLMQLERHKEALADFAKLISRHPDDPQAYTGRAYAHQLLGNEDSAANDVEHLQKLAPEKSTEFTIQILSAKVQRLENEERYEEALASAEEIISLAPEDQMGYQLRAWIYWYTEQYVQARDEYTHLMEMTPDQIDLLNSRGQVQAEMGDFEAALRDLDEAVALSREAGQQRLLAFALNGRALTLAGLSRIDEAECDYEESIRLCPTNAWAYYNRGIVMHHQGDNQAASELLKAALAAESPALTKRKRERAQALVTNFDASDSDL